MRRQLGAGLVAAAIAALAAPLAIGVASVASPAAPATPVIAEVAASKPPPPVSKYDPPPSTVKPPVSIADRTTQAERPTAGPTVSGCGGTVSGMPGTAPSKVSPKGVNGTTSTDLLVFAQAYNAKRVANCLTPIPMANFRYDACMELRLFWMAEDPSTDPTSAWGHIGSKRSDGVPSVGCDGNLAGGMNNTGETVARKWWDSSSHRASLYKPSFSGSTSSVCIFFAMTHGGVPDEPYAFVRSAARWATC